MQNKSGILGIALIPADGIYEPSVTDGEVHEKKLNLKTGAAFTHFYFTPGTAGFGQQLRYFQKNPYYNINIRFRVPRLRAERNRHFSQFTDKELLAIVTDQNLHRWLVGTHDYPLKLGIKKADIPSSPGRMNGYSLEVKGKCPSLAAEVTPAGTTLVTPPEPGAPNTETTPGSTHEITLPYFNVAFIRMWWKENGVWNIGEVYTTFSRVGNRLRVEYDYRDHSESESVLDPSVSLQGSAIVLTLHTQGISEIHYTIEKY